MWAAIVFARMRTALLGVAVVVAAGLVLLVVSGSDPRRTGTNNIQAGGETARLEPGQRRCQPAEIPGGTERIAIPAVAEVGVRTRLAVVVRNANGSRVGAGRALAVAPDGDLLATLRPAPPAGLAEVCIVNNGRGSVALLGFASAFGIDYYGRSETWWEAAPSIARHFGFGKAGFLGAWAFWLSLALIASAWIVAWRALANPEPHP